MTSLPKKESLTVEFKSDRKALSDNAILETVVALANTEGGDLYIGVEDDGTPSGIHATHHNLIRLAAMIGNKTMPSVAARTEALHIDGQTIHKVTVERQRESLVATADGRVLRRRLKYDGNPENVPVYPYEFARMLSDIGRYDLTDQPILEADSSLFSAIERERLKQMILHYNGEKALLELANDDLDKALGFVTSKDNRMIPTVTGVLLLGDEAALRTLIPTHEVMFQVLDGLEVRVNDSLRGSILQIVEKIIERFHSRNSEQEMDDGMFRIPVPDFDERAFREALINALAHRDYSALGAVHVQLTDEGVLIMSPGGFVDGISQDSLLTAPPRSRNPRLADALKRIGLAERTGRGVDRIFQGQLRYGRPAPNYHRSNSVSVQVLLPRAPADKDFLHIILQAEQRQGGLLPVEQLLILNQLRQYQRMTREEITTAFSGIIANLDEQLKILLDDGIVEVQKIRNVMSYSLKDDNDGDSQLDLAESKDTDYLQRILQYVDTHGKITRRETAELLTINPYQANRLLSKLSYEKQLIPFGLGRGTYYQRST